MLNILVVDDEKLLCESLKLKIQAIGNVAIDQIYSTTSGEEALDILTQCKVDMMITDIKMPRMNGIALIKEVKERKYSTKFMVLSGYDDYTYVREAFSLGAIDYILKPASIEDLREKIELAIIKIKEDKLHEQNEQALKNQNRIYTLKNYLSRLTQDITQEDEDLKKLLSYQKTGIIVIHFNEEFYAYKQSQVIETLWGEYAKGLVNKASVLYSFWIEEGRFVILYNFDEEGIQKRTIEQLESYLLALKGVMESHIAVSVSRTSEIHEELPVLYKESLEMLKYKILFPSCTVIPYDVRMRKRKSEPILSKSQLQLLAKEDSNDVIQHITEMIQEYFEYERVRDEPIESIEQLYDMMVNRLEHLKEMLLFSNEAKRKKEFDKFESITHLKVYLREALYEVKKLSLAQNQREKTVGEIATKYIKENYHKEIDMSVVANMVSMNYTYFSELFKKQTGMNFRGYIIKVKMEEAKKQLHNPLNKINDIAQHVGYDNPKHFTRAFKNYYGKSPSDYRVSMYMSK